MESNEIIVGLDIGTTKIACFVGVRGDNGCIKILGFGRTDSKGVEHGVVKGIIQATESIKLAVQEASDQAGVDIDEVWVGIAGQHIKSRPQQGSVMIPPEHMLIEQSDLDNLVQSQYNIMLEPGEEIIHIFPQQYYVDTVALSRDIDPVGVAGKTLAADFHMVTGNVQNLQYIKMAVERAGLKIKGVVLEPVASAKAVLDDCDRDAGVAMVDIGGGTTDIAIFHDGIIRHTSVLPLAGNAVTGDIREGCNILPKQAETLKVKYGSCLVQAVPENDVITIPGIRSQPPREIYVKSLAGIINARAKMIMEQVDYEIKLSGYSKKLIAGVVLTGGGSRLKDLKQLCELVTATPTRIGVPDGYLDPESVNYDDLLHPMYSTGIGLVLYGLEQSELASAKVAEKDEKKDDAKKFDIFEGLDATEKKEPAGPKVDVEEKEGEEKGKKGFDRFVAVVNKFLGNIFTEPVD
ncbi:MAG: cell division protein FtsA [Bacteroidales bacterium]|nr:cell division protein FtsA [Bacteroidales bacterium]